jgi:uncharacterized membrane protein YkoI
MNQPHPRAVKSARDEPAMSSLLCRNGDTPALPLVHQPTLGGTWPDPPPAIEDIAMLDNQMKPASWRSGPLAVCRAALMAATVLTAAGFALAGGAVAGEIKDEPRWKNPKDYSSLKDWHLKGENIVPHGINPLYYPIVPGHKHVHERPDHPDGFYRKETVVLDSTEDFDVPGIGKFKTAVVQEEEYLDGVLTQRALNWFALDKTTNSVYSFGEVSWEINEEGKPIFEGTWRVGELDGDGIAEPGLLMPGTFTVGGRYIFDGSQSTAYGGSENMEAGVEITVPAGTFKGCVRVREQGLVKLSDITDKIWCPVVGVVLDTSDGKLVASAALPKDNPASDVSSIGKLRDKPLKYTPPVAKVSGDQATKIALELIPGKATSVKIERKLGKNVYTVEIQTPQGEKDVFVDIESGKIVGTD